MDKGVVAHNLTFPRIVEPHLGTPNWAPLARWFENPGFGNAMGTLFFDWGFWPRKFSSHLFFKGLVNFWGTNSKGGFKLHGGNFFFFLNPGPNKEFV